MRFRSIIHALSVELFGEDLVISEFPVRKDLAGAGMSDWEGYAERLPEKLLYQNTFYHTAPFLDVTNVDPAQFGRYDFIISTDVFEHISPPTAIAFQNVYKLLKPGGVFLFSVPYQAGETKEHFPSLKSFSIEKRNGEYVLINKTEDNRIEVFEHLTFHGGDGRTVEMRIFGRDTLLREFKEAGFRHVQIMSEDVPKHGIVWISPEEENANSRPSISRMSTPTWAARK